MIVEELIDCSHENGQRRHPLLTTDKPDRCFPLFALAVRLMQMMVPRKTGPRIILLKQVINEFIPLLL